jgi:SAM-dependent methyltransferase
MAQLGLRGAIEYIVDDHPQKVGKYDPSDGVPIVRQALEEIKRVLKPEGLFQGTMISKRHNRYGDGKEIRPNTFVVDDDVEKSHPHFYCNDRELVGLLAGFQLLRLEDREQREPGMWHWEFLAERVAST